MIELQLGLQPAVRALCAVFGKSYGTRTLYVRNMWAYVAHTGFCMLPEVRWCRD